MCLVSVIALSSMIYVGAKLQNFFGYQRIAPRKFALCRFWLEKLKSKFVQVDRESGSVGVRKPV